MPLRENRSKGKLTFGTLECDAQRFFRPLLGGPGDGSTSPFFELPAELRNNVYGYLFQFPSSRIDTDRPQHRLGHRRLAVLSRSCSDEFDRKAWTLAASQTSRTTWLSPDQNGLIRTKTVAEILSPLLTNRQFCHEAMPVFYEIDRFHFMGTEEMESALRTVAPERRRHIAHTSFKYLFAKEDCSLAKKAFQLLAKLDGLRNLEICLDESRHTVQRGELSVSGLSDIRKLRGLEELKFHGSCPKLEAILKDELTIQKPIGESSKKRKAGNMDRPLSTIDEGDESVGRARSSTSQ